MGLSELFSFSPSEEVQKSQNDRIAIEIAEKLTKLIKEFEDDYEDGVEVINESLTNLADKDRELTSSILKVLKERHSVIDKKFPFKINT